MKAERSEAEGVLAKKGSFTENAQTPPAGLAADPAGFFPPATRPIQTGLQPVGKPKFKKGCTIEVREARQSRSSPAGCL
jgi:hypothetical protein